MQFPDTLNEIGKGAFKSSGITLFIAPPELSVLGEDAFCSCESLTQAYLSSDIAVIESGCFKRTNISEIVIPSLVEQIKEDAFFGCGQLQRVTFMRGSQLRSLEKFCFAESGL